MAAAGRAPYLGVSQGQAVFCYATIAAAGELMRYRFGLFEFDDSQLVLRREQTVVRLQSQPARLLACLLRERERVVSRDELRRSVWGDSTFVDFNGGLNFCVAQVRSALCDDPSSPRYIRTIPKLGYQFIAPVEAVEDPGRNGKPVSPRIDHPARISVQVGIMLLLLALAFVGGYRLRLHAKGASMPIVAVARFDNETSDPALNPFADRLTDAVVAQLTNSGQGQFSVIGNAHILRLPRDQRDLRTIGAQLDAKYIVLGQVMPAGDQTRILAHLIRLPEQTHLWVERLDRPRPANGAGEDEVANRISGAFTPRLAADIRSGYSSAGLGR
jgi:DNA-binding winged helix-turn-helix (wHTH) protein/TolB-like protein